MEQLTTVFRQYVEGAFEYLRRPEILIQLGLVIVLFGLAHFLSRRITPPLERRARNIKGMPGLLRFIVAFLRRLRWLFFAGLLAIAHAVVQAGSWLGRDYLVYSAMLLSAAWLLISVVSLAIRNRGLRRMFALLAWSWVAIHILSISDDIARILDSAGFTVGDMRLSVLSLLQITVFLAALIWVALNLGNFMDRRLQQVGELTPSLRVLLGKILRIMLLVFAALIAMQVMGIDLTALTVLSGAVGVGIGFGLQKVVSNFISGIIILMDQSIKPGDTITLGDTFGWIRELRARFVSVVTRDGREYLIPNEDFITTQVINWSFSDRWVRLDVPFGVSYDSDPHEVTRLAIEAAASVGRVDASNRKPVCWMTAFGDSSLDFLLRFWIEDPQKGLTNIRGKVLLALWDTFKENGVKIPYPHREVIMKTPVQVSRPEP